MKVNKDIDRIVPQVETWTAPVVTPKFRPYRPNDFNWSEMEAAEKDAKHGVFATIMGILAILGVITAGVLIVSTMRTAGAISAQNEASETPEIVKLDGSTAGANAVTVDELVNDGDIVWPEHEVMDGVEIWPATDEPIPILPIGWHSFDISDKNNRTYTVITNGRGIAVIPKLDENGEQVVIPHG